MKWIKVEDNLPDKPYKDVLVYYKDGAIGIGFYDLDYRRMNSNTIYHGNITHWMPLPAPPAKEEEGK